MKDFDIDFEGKWIFRWTYQANSKEEALEEAFHDLCGNHFPLEIIILGQGIDGEKMDKSQEIYRSPGWQEP